MVDDKTPSQQKTRLRQPPDATTDLEATRPLGRQMSPPPVGADRHRRIAVALVLAAAGAGLLLVLAWWPTADLPAPTPKPVEVSPAVQAPAAGSDNDFQSRLRVLEHQATPALSEAELTQQLDALFQTFQTALAAGNLLLPAADSASEYLLRMTALGPEHPRVLEARSLLAQAFLERAREARLAERWEEADRYLQHAVDIRLGPASRQTDSQAE